MVIKKSKLVCITLMFFSLQILLLPEVYMNNNCGETVGCYSNDICWKYKKENGKLYKRLYNCVSGKWLGDWILVK